MFYDSHTSDSKILLGIVGISGGMEDYKVKVVEKFQKCLYRQVDEEFETAGGMLLNSNYEYYIPKIVQPVFCQQ